MNLPTAPLLPTSRTAAAVVREAGAGRGAAGTSAVEGTDEPKIAVAPIDTSPRRILVVDDASVVRESLVEQLTRPGIEVEASGSVSDAEARIRERVFDLVLASWHLPAGAGVEFLARLRIKAPRIARALITGEQDLSIMRRAINQAAVCFFLTKPWDTQCLNDLLESVLGHVSFPEGVAPGKSRADAERGSASASAKI